MVYESNWIIGAWKTPTSLEAKLQSGGLSVRWLHKEEGKGDEPKLEKKCFL